jgi:hypothetical protein
LIRRAIPLKRAATEPSHLAVKFRCDVSCPASVHRITVSLTIETDATTCLPDEGDDRNGGGAASFYFYGGKLAKRQVTG